MITYSSFSALVSTSRQFRVVLMKVGKPLFPTCASASMLRCSYRTWIVGKSIPTLKQMSREEIHHLLLTFFMLNFLTKTWLGLWIDKGKSMNDENIQMCREMHFHHFHLFTINYIYDVDISKLFCKFGRT